MRNGNPRETTNKEMGWGNLPFCFKGKQALLNRQNSLRQTSLIPIFFRGDTPDPR